MKKKKKVTLDDVEGAGNNNMLDLNKKIKSAAKLYFSVIQIIFNFLFD